MGVISGYPDDDAIADDDKYLTYDNSGATKLTNAGDIKEYILPDASVTSAKLNPTIATVTSSGWTYKKYDMGSFFQYVGEFVYTSTANTTEYGPYILPDSLSQSSPGFKLLSLQAVSEGGAYVGTSGISPRLGGSSIRMYSNTATGAGRFVIAFNVEKS